MCFLCLRSENPETLHWNQFEAEIDKADIGQVAKFSYLKELVEPKVRLTIEGLPFSTEGYERAKQILKTKYGKPSEVANAHIQGLMALPTIHGTQPWKIHEFYDKLVMNVQALETMGKLIEVNGYVRLTLDKLPGIRADLVRMDNDWQEWNSPSWLKPLERGVRGIQSFKESKLLVIVVTGHQEEKSFFKSSNKIEEENPVCTASQVITSPAIAKQ